jgi:hypothetical protein
VNEMEKVVWQFGVLSDGPIAEPRIEDLISKSNDAARPLAVSRAPSAPRPRIHPLNDNG